MSDFLCIYLIEYVALFDVATFTVIHSHQFIRTCFVSGFWIASTSYQLVLVRCIIRTSRLQFISAIIP